MTFAINLDFHTNLDFHNLGLAEFAQCLENNGLIAPEFKLLEHFSERELFAYAGPSVIAGRVRYVLADVNDEGGCDVNEAWVYIARNGKLCADYAGWPMLENVSADRAVEFVEQIRRVTK